MFFNGPLGWRILKGEKEMQKLGLFLDLLFYSDPKKLFDISDYKCISSVQLGYTFTLVLKKNS
jgi:hypothetical protein